MRNLPSELVLALVSSGNCGNIEEAEALVDEMFERIHSDNEDPEEILAEYNLEPDYVFDIIYRK